MKRLFHLALVLPLILFAGTGLASQKDKETAESYYQKAIRLQGSSRLEEIFELYARSAELGNPVAQYNLAMMYSNGESVYVDYQQAVYWFRKSAGQSFAPAQYRLGELYYFARGGLERDLDKAIELFNMAAKQKDADAQMNLAMLCGTGEGLPLDKEKSLSWLLKARIGGNPAARDYQRMLNESALGRFTPEQQHRYWLEKAAELGIRKARQESQMMGSYPNP